MHRLTVLAFVLCNVTSAARAHYHILLPQDAATERDKPVSFVLQFGHPFEHELFDAAQPESLVVVLPDRKIEDLAKALKKDTAKTGDQKDIAIYRFQYTPANRGDFTFILRMPPLWMEQEQHFLRDTVRVTLHVVTQKNWDHFLGKGFEMVPLTRPYGLQAGTVFQAQALVGGKPLPRALVEIERLNVVPPKDLPHDEQITRTVKTDPNGVATCTLPEHGWWCITVQRAAGMLERQGKTYPLRERSTLWVFVGDQAKDARKR